MPEAQKTRGMAIKMDKTTIIVSAVVGSLGVLSAVLGFSAEGTKLTPYTILVSDYDCIYPQNPALGLAICAVIFLLAAQVTVSAAGGCCGCCKSRSIPSETKRIIGIICAVVSWIAAVIAWALLIDGAAWNANVVRVAAAPYCPYLKDGVFAGAGVLALAATALGITSFIMLRSQPAPAAPATPTPGTSVTATPNWAGGQSPVSVTGIPLLPAQHPSKLQAAYVQVQQVPPTAASHPQQNGQAPQNQVPAAAAAPAPAQDNGSQHQQAPNQQLPAQGLVAGAALPAAAYAPQELGVAMVQPPQVPLPQVAVPVPTDALQYSVPVPATAAAPLVCGAEIPAITAAPATGPPPQGTGLATVIRNQVAREGIKFAADMIRHNLLSNNTDTSTTLPGAGDGGILSMMTDSTGGDVQATN